MGFDIGGALGAFGTESTKFGLQAQKDKAEQDKIQLASDLSAKNAAVGRAETHANTMEQQTQSQGATASEGKLNREAKERESTATNATTRETNAATVGASKEHTAALERIEQNRREGALDVAKEQGSTRIEVANANRQATLEKLGMSRLAEGEPLDTAAQNYIDTGKTGNFGRSGGVVQVQIMTRAAEMLKAQGKTLADIRPMWSTREAAAKDLANQQKLGSQLANYNETLEMNIKALQDLKDGFGPRWGPLLTKYVQHTREGIIGDPEVSALKYKLSVIAQEAAKLNTGQLGIAGLPEGAREDSQKIMNEFKSPETIERVVDAIRSDAHNRLTAQITQVHAAEDAVATGHVTPYTDRNPVGATPNQMRDNPKGYPTVPTIDAGDGKRKMDRNWLLKQPAGPVFIPGVGVRPWNGKDGFGE